MKEGEKALTGKLEKYCQARFKGLSQRKAYIEAFGRGNKKDASLDTLASNLEKQNRVKIQSRLQYLQNGVANKNIADEIEIQEFYTSQIRDLTISSRDRRGSADSLAKTKGMFTEKIEHSGEIVLPNIIISK